MESRGPRASIPRRVLLLCATFLALTACPPGRPTIVPTERLGGAGVHGSIYADSPKAAQTQVPSDLVVYVPDFEVYLVSVATGVKSERVKTDLFGRYLIKRQDAGQYRLCWDMPGWVPGCNETVITIGNNTKYPSPTRVQPVTTRERGPVFGRVRQGDGSSPWYSDQYFAIEQTALLTANDGSGDVASARANVAGDYILTLVPRAAVTITARLGAGGRTRSLNAADFDPGSGVAIADVTMLNRPPILGSVTALLGGRGVRESDPGVELDVAAEIVDPDGDPLQIQWKPQPASGDVAGTGPNVRWRLPRETGLRTLYVVVNDRNGGYARKSVTIATGPRDVRFSGTVVTQGGSPIDGATIEINGVGVASSNTQGTFTTTVARSEYYVVNVRKSGFAEYSRIYDRGNVRDVYPLVRAQVLTVNPGGVIDITDRREELQNKRLRGVRFIFPPNSLVAEDGSAPPPTLQNATATLDVARGEMPGNYGAIAGGRETNLISFGAAFTEFTDASGRRYNLRSGTPAQIILPVPEAMLSTAPDEIVLWSYNTRTGYWDDSAGKARLDRAIGSYVGELRHLSSINTDIVINNAACLKITLDNVTLTPGLAKVRISYVSGPTPFVQTPELILGDVENAILRLPPNDVVHIDVLDASGTTPISTAVILDNDITPVATGNVNVGPATVPTLPLPPYANCHKVTIKLGVPDWGGFPGSPFLTFPGGSEANAIGYYTAVNPGSSYNAGTQTWSGGNRDTLGAWWQLAGFGSSGEDNGGKSTAYLNYNDLGFGRDMHIRSSGGDVFAYVTNYGAPDQNPLNADYAANQDLAQQGATVCMEYTAQAGVPGRVVKFFVYGGGGPAAKLINSANLDGFGDKYVPNLCQNCHGGVFYSPTVPASPSALDISLRSNLAVTVGSSFREFDIPAFRFPGGLVLPDATTKQALYDLNQLVKLSSPQPAITDLIDGLYAVSPPDQDNNWAPADWKTGITGSANTEPLYRDVVGRSCRTCHVGFGSDQNQGLNWNTYSQFQSYRAPAIQNAVCGSYKYMPHALITYKNFWLSTGPNRPTALKSFTGPGWAAYGVCN